MAPPSRPVRVTMASPRTVRPAKVSPTPFRGHPSKRSRNSGDQSTRNPQLLGLRSATVTPAASRGATQAPSVPSCGQLAPPSASTAASVCTDTSPSGVAKRIAPSASQPVHRWRGRNATPARSSRRSQARSRGDGLEARRKDASAGADDGRLAEVGAPRPQPVGRKGLDRLPADAVRRRRSGAGTPQALRCGSG